MAESLKLEMPERLSDREENSPWAPLREPLFRSLWIAAVISYTGTWMQNVGAGWLMTLLTVSPFMVGLVQAAATLPVFLVILPAGALADMVAETSPSCYGFTPPAQRRARQIKRRR